MAIMVTGQMPPEVRPLLGLRAPSQLADAPVQPAETQPAKPARPAYQVVSSGWDSEDDGRRGGSDLLTAVGAGAMLMAVILGVALLIG